MEEEEEVTAEELNRMREELRRLTFPNISELLNPTSYNPAVSVTFGAWLKISADRGANNQPREIYYSLFLAPFLLLVLYLFFFYSLLSFIQLFLCIWLLPALTPT